MRQMLREFIILLGYKFPHDHDLIFSEPCSGSLEKHPLNTDPSTQRSYVYDCNTFFWMCDEGIIYYFFGATEK